MKVARESLDGTTVAALRVVDPEGGDRHAGEHAGYLCPECGAHDETLRQLLHEDGCSLAGTHGRAHYESLPDVPPQFSDAIDSEHPVTILRAAETTTDARRGEPLAFECDYCGNSDETLAEIVHDEDCPLAAVDAGEVDLAVTDVTALRGVASE